MVKLRKSHNKLKIILCSVLGAIVAVGGVLGIWKLSTALSGDKVIDAPDNTVSVRKELPSGATYTQLHSDGLDTLGYLAYVLDRQEYYHSVANTVSTALIATQYTNSFKDYKDGIMLSSDFTYGFTGAGTQSCFVPDGNANGEGAGVYMRTSSGSVNGSTTGTGANWNDDVVYYDKDTYLYKYGQYSTEMTVYILNEETVLSWDDVVENGDGTYSQTFYLDAEKAAYYYQYAMQTRGGLDTLPQFESITLTFTFDDNYRVLKIDATEVSEITYIFSMSSTSQTTTTYSYEQETFDEAHYDYFDSYYEQYVGQLETGGGDEPELDALTLLGTAFADVVNGTGDQFDATVTLGDSVYYGRIYLNVPMSAFSSSDVIGALDVRLALSADSLFDSQDLYIQLKDGEVSGYYSSDFALKVNINDFSQLISKFENWVSSLGGSSDAEVLAETSSDSGFSLEDILNGLVLTEREGGATIALNLDDLFGIGLSAELNFTSSEGENGTTYAFANASVGNISYNGSPISLSLALTPSAADTISHEESDSPFDLTVAANSLYELLNSETISAQLTLEGDKLADVLANYNLADLGGSIDDLRLEITGSVDINGVTVGAQARIYRAGDNSDVLNADVYYEIDPSAGDYGTAYLNIKNILGAECDVKAYSNVSELVSAIEKIIARFGSEGGSAEVSALAEDSATDIAALINDILSLDFGSIIKEVQGNGTVIGATLNVDSVLAVLLGDVSVGDITLEYHLGDFEAENYNQNGGWLYGSLPSLGIEAYAYGSTASLTQPEKDEYLDINDLINSMLDLLNSNTVKVGLDLEGESLAAVLNANGITGYDSVLNGATLNVTGYASIKKTAAKADITLKITGNTIFVASVYYAYTNDGTYGVAYLNITNILGKSFTDLKVYCNISELAATIQGLLGSGVATLSDTTGGETNEIADIISQVLNINFGAMVKELAANASGLTATADLDEILGEFAGVDLGLGTVTLKYNITSNTLSGEALNGGLDIIVSGDEMTISEPADKDTYLDANKLLNSVLDLLNKNTVTVDLEIKGAAVADILGKANIADIGAAIDGLTLKVNGGVSIDDLAAAINLTLVGNDSATNEEKVYLDADIYYDYGDSGNSDGENYGTAYISINELLGVSFVEENTANDENTVSKVKIYADIAAAKNNVEALIEQITQIIDAALTPAQADYAVSTYSEDGENAVADIIARVLGIDFTKFVSEIRTSADGFTATADIDYILSYFSVGEYGLGDVTLTYSIKDGTLIGSARQDGEDADWLKVTVGGKDEDLVPPDESAYLDVNELVNSVRNLLASNTVALDIDLTGDKLAELLIANGVSSDYADLLKGLTLEIDGRASIADLAAEVSVKLYGDTTYLEMSAFYNYDTKAADESGVVPSNYGEVYVNISKLLGNDSAIKVYCDITEAVESINTLLSEAAQAGVATLSESGGNALGLGDIQSIIEGVLTFDLPSLIGELSADAKGLTVTLNADELIGLFFEDNKITVGTVTLTYNINNKEGAAVGTLSGSALGGGLKITVKGDSNPLNAPEKDDYLNVNTVLDLINKAKAAAQEIIDSRSVYFALGDGANAGAEVEVNGINAGISGTGEVKWDENGTVTNLALDIKLWIANGSAENSKSTTTVKLIYNNAVADDEPFVTLAINNVGIKITQNDIAQMGNDVNNLIANVTALINALTGGSDGNGGNNGEITQQLLTTLAEAAGESTAKAPDGNNTPADTDYLAIVKLVLGLLGGDDDTVGGSLGNVLEEALSSLLSGSSVSVGELGDSLKLILAGAADITLGVNDGALTLAGNISDIANLDISVSAGKFTNGAGTVASALEEQFNATTESGAAYTFYSASESGSFSKVIYDFVLGAYESIDIGSFLGGKTYQVTFSLAGDASQIEALKGVNVNATLYFGNGITNGELDKGKLLEADIDLSINGFTFKANLFYNNRNFYISVSNIGGTTLSGLNVKVSADDIYSAAENIVALINNPEILALFTGADGEGSADIAGDGEGAENVSLLSDETSSSLTDVIAAILGMKLSEVITISNSGTETLVTADIDKVLSEFGVSQKVGTAQLVVDSGDSKKIALYLGNKDSEYNWLELVSELATDYNGSADSANLSSYIDIGFIDELISDLSKFITSNEDSGNISTLFTLTNGSITLGLHVDIGIQINIDVNITEIKTTIGLDDSGEIYFSFEGLLNGLSGLVSITESRIGFTYYNGYLTLARDLDSSSPIYWVMTLDYFIDHLFAQDSGNSDSPIRWLTRLEIAWGIYSWNSLANELSSSIDLSSGLSNPDSLYLYNSSVGSGSSATSLFDYITGILVDIGGNTVTSYNSTAVSTSNLGVNSDYYAFSLDLSSLIGDVLDDLDIALTRNETTGLGGVNVYAAAVDNLITVSANLGYGGYAEPVANFYEKAEQAAGDGGIDYAYYDGENDNSADYADWIFGGVKVESGNITYDYSEKLLDGYVTVYVKDIEGNVTEYKLKYGSTIYLYSMEHLVTTEGEDGKQYAVIYVNEADYDENASSGSLPTSMVANSDTILTNDTTGEKYINIKAVVTENQTVTLTLYNVTADGEAELLGEYKVFAGAEIPTDVYGGYALLGDTWYEDEELAIPYVQGEGGVTQNLTLYGRFVRNSVTVNGVVYQFVNASDGVAAHYEITGTTTEIATYYDEGTTLYLENEIDGYPVTAIRANAFDNSTGSGRNGSAGNVEANSLKNVIVPSNITYVGGGAFLDNKGMQSIMFLADTVTFANNSLSDSRYPFYGCSREGAESTTRLQIYYNSFNGGDYNSVFCFQNDNVIGDYGRGGGVYGNGAWAYVMYNITLNGNTYNDAFGDFELNSGIITSLPANNTEEQIADYVTGIIDAFTYSTTAEHYIGLYKVSVDRAVELTGGMLTINIEITESGEKWLPVTVTHVGVDDEGKGTGNHSFAAEDEVRTYTVGGVSYTYLKVGATYTLTVSSASSTFIGFETSLGIGEGAALKFEMPDGAAEIKVEWEKNPEREVSVYSKVAFTYNDNTLSSSGTTYYIGESSIGDSGKLDGVVKATDDYVGYYFLGWAVNDDETLKFTTSPEAVYDSEAVSYYAIWAYSSKEITGYTASYGSSVLSKPTANGVTFYKWYKNSVDKSFGNEITDIDLDNTVVVARWAYKLNVLLSFDGASKIVVDKNDVNDGNNLVAAPNVTNGDNAYKAFIYIPEGGSVALSYDTSSEKYLDWGIKTATYTHVKIDVNDGLSTFNYEFHAKKDGGTSSRLLSVLADKTSGWDTAPVSGVSIDDSNKNEHGVKVSVVTGDISIGYKG